MEPAHSAESTADANESWRWRAKTRARDAGPPIEEAVSMEEAELRVEREAGRRSGAVAAAAAAAP